MLEGCKFKCSSCESNAEMSADFVRLVVAMGWRSAADFPCPKCGGQLCGADRDSPGDPPEASVGHTESSFVIAAPDDLAPLQQHCDSLVAPPNAIQFSVIDCNRYADPVAAVAATNPHAFALACVLQVTPMCSCGSDEPAVHTHRPNCPQRRLIDAVGILTIPDSRLTAGVPDGHLVPPETFVDVLVERAADEGKGWSLYSDSAFQRWLTSGQIFAAAKTAMAGLCASEAGEFIERTLAMTPRAPCL
jgi:hypothetical protein